MKTLESQLAGYGAHHEDEQERIQLEDVVGVRVTASRRTGRPRFWVAGAAAVIVLAVVGAVPLLLTGDGETQPVDTAPGVTNPVIVAEPAPSTVPQAVRTEGWVQVPSWPGPNPTWISAYPSGGFVAGSLNAPALFSTDGLNWTSESFDQALVSYRDLYIKGRFALANSIGTDFPELDENWVPGLAQPSGIGWETLLEFVDGSWKVWDVGSPVLEPPVQYGNITLVYPLNPDGGAPETYLVTTDGVTFESHTMPAFADVVSRPEFFTHPSGFGVYQEINRLYVSDDGVTWSRVDIPDFVPSVGGAPHVVHFFDLGDQVVGQPWSDALLWTSPDGQQWTSSPEPEDPWSETKRALHKTSSGLVLTATQWELPDLAIWFSEDGAEWTLIDGPPQDAVAQKMPVISVAEDTIFYLPPIGGEGATWTRQFP